MMKRKKAEVDIKSILVGLIFIVLMASLFGVMIQGFTSTYTVDTGATTKFLNTVSPGYNSTEYLQEVNEYNSTLFEDRDTDILDWLDFMWRGAWQVMKSTLTLPFKVVGIANAAIGVLGIPQQVSYPIIIFISTMITLIIIWAIIYKIRGSR